MVISGDFVPPGTSALSPTYLGLVRSSFSHRHPPAAAAHAVGIGIRERYPSEDVRLLTPQPNFGQSLCSDFKSYIRRAGAGLEVTLVLSNCGLLQQSRTKGPAQESKNVAFANYHATALITMRQKGQDGPTLRWPDDSCIIIHLTRHAPQLRC